MHSILYRRHRLTLLRAIKANLQDQFGKGVFEPGEEAQLRECLKRVTEVANKAHAELCDLEWRYRTQEDWPKTLPLSLEPAR